MSRNVLHSAVCPHGVGWTLERVFPLLRSSGSHERRRVNRVPMRWGASSFIAQYGLRPEDALFLASSPQVLETSPPARARTTAGPVWDQPRLAYAFSSAAAPDTETVTSP